MNEESGVTQFTDVLADTEFDKLEELLYRPKWGYTHKSTADDKWRRWRMELKDDSFFTEFFLLSALKGISFGVLSWRLFDLQVIENKKYDKLSKDNQFNFSLVIPLFDPCKSV